MVRCNTGTVQRILAPGGSTVSLRRMPPVVIRQSHPVWPVSCNLRRAKHPGPAVCTARSKKGRTSATSMIPSYSRSPDACRLGNSQADVQTCPDCLHLALSYSYAPIGSGFRRSAQQSARLRRPVPLTRFLARDPLPPSEHIRRSVWPRAGHPTSP